MSLFVDGQEVVLIHVRHDGRSHGIRVEDLGVTEENLSRDELFTAVETNLDLSVGILSGYELDVTAETHNAVIRPQAKFGN